MISKEIVAFGERQVIACDKKCEKAFGLNGRPFEQLSEDVDDIVWLADSEVGIAPTSGKTVIMSEGFNMKPNPDLEDSLLNKWCYRQCERCVSAKTVEAIQLPDFSKRQYNQPFKHQVEA
jgi:hypothetical protein